MAWISFTPFEKATGRLKASYEKHKRANNTVANIITLHSLRPYTMDGHLSFYRLEVTHKSCGELIHPQVLALSDKTCS